MPSAPLPAGADPLALGGAPAAGGTVHLVGGGPGDPGLLTLRAARLLSTCDVVAYDRLSPIEALDLVPPTAERVCVGRRSGDAGRPQSDVDALLVERARRGLAVVRLKGGDPYVFGRGGEEALACLEAGVPCEVVGAVTSAIAAPQAAGIPVTHRGVSVGFAVVTAHEDPSKGGSDLDYDALARFPGTLVLMMGVGQSRRVSAGLIAHGKAPDTPVALVRWGTTSRQEVLESTLADYPAEVERSGFAPPAVTVIGDVVALRSRLPSRADGPEDVSAALAAAVADLAHAAG